MPTQKNLFIIGAPKSGTTSLVAWLGTHPAIFVPRIKEPGYFRDNSDAYILDAHTPDVQTSMSDNPAMVDFGAYMSLFEGADPGQWAVDGSTDYLSSPETARRIQAFAKDREVRLIAILRDPIDRAVSEYRHSRRDKIETLSFRESLDAEEERVAKGYQPLFFHIRRSRYYSDIKTYQSLFGARLLILDYATLKTPEVLQGQICRHLGIAPTDMGVMPTLNPSVRANSASLKARLKSSMNWFRARDEKPPQSTGITAEDRLYLNTILKDEIARCQADPDIPTESWKMPAAISTS